MAKKVMGGKMRSTGVGAGGGIGNRVIKHSAAPKTEPRARAVNVRGVSQIGSSMGNHADGGKVSAGKAVEPLYAGKGYSTPVGANTNSRPTNYGMCGTQAQHGAVAGTTKPQGRDILSDFGPESKPR